MTDRTRSLRRAVALAPLPRINTDKSRLELFMVGVQEEREPLLHSSCCWLPGRWIWDCSSASRSQRSSRELGGAVEGDRGGEGAFQGRKQVFASLLGTM